MGVTDDQDGLFEVPELVALPNAGRAEAGLARALREAADAQLLQAVDGGMVAAALAGARALDRAEALRDDKAAVYAVAQALPPFQRILHALGLPLERSPVGGPAAPVPGPGGPVTSSWLSDELGPS